jgi:hypothetical protein
VLAFRGGAGVGFGLQGGHHGLDRDGAADGRAGDGQDVTFGLAHVMEASNDYSVVADAEGEGRDESEAKPGGDEALGGPVFVGFHDRAGRESGLLEGGVGRDAWLQHRPRLRAAQPRLEGFAYLGLASWAAITGSRSDH